MFLNHFVHCSHYPPPSLHSDLITTSSRSRTSSLLQKVDFNSGIKSLNTYRSFYTSLKFEEGRLRHLDRKLAHEFQVKNLTIKEEDEEGQSPMMEFSVKDFSSSEEGGSSFKRSGPRTPKSESEKGMSSRESNTPESRVSSRPSSSNRPR